MRSANCPRLRSAESVVPLAILVMLFLSVLPVLDSGTTNTHSMGQSGSGTAIENIYPALELHDPISISGDAEFDLAAESEGWLGNGTSENPYVIQNLYIDANGSAVDCIRISSVYYHFIIRDCVLRGANATNKAAIYLSTTPYATVSDNDCRQSYVGIAYNWYTLESPIINNTCDGNTWAGIQVMTDLPGVAVVNNTCTRNGHGIDVSGSFRLERNTCTDNSGSGILISDHPANRFYQIYNNSLFRNAYGLWDRGSAIAMPSIDSRWNLFGNNTVNAIGSVPGTWDFNFWSDYTGNDTDLDGVGDTPYAFNYGKQDNHPMMMPQWIALPDGIDCELGDELSVDMKTYLWSFWRLDQWWLNDTSNVMMVGYGVLGNATILPVGAFPVEIWVNDTLGHTARAILQVRVLDRTPPVWVIAPQNQYLTPQDAIDFNIIVHDLSEITSWTINDTEHFVLFWWRAESPESTCVGLVCNATALGTGLYHLLVRVQDLYSNQLTSCITVFVSEPQADSTPPVWVIEASYQTVEFGDHLSLQLAAWDASGIGSWSVNDTSRFDIGPTGRLTTIQPLLVGLYGLSVTVADVFNNSISSDFQIDVVDTTSPAWLTFIGNLWLDEGEYLEYPIAASDRSGIDHWWLNDTNHFEIDEQGTIRNATVLASGIYSLEVRAYDPYGNYCSARLILTVHEVQTVSTTTTTEPAMNIGTFVIAGVAGGAGLTVLIFLVGRRMGQSSSS